MTTYASGLSGPMMPRANFTRASSHIRLEDLPPSVDWREQGVINPVRDQGMWHVRELLGLRSRRGHGGLRQD